MAHDEQAPPAGTKIQVVFQAEDMDLLRDLDDEVHRRKQGRDTSANRSALILEYVRLGRSKAKRR